MSYFEEMGPLLSLFPEKYIQRFPWAASEGSPHPTNGTPNLIHLLVIRLGAVAQWALKRIQEHSWHHGNILITTPECPQMLMSALEFSRLLISVHDCSSAWFQKHSKCEFSKWAPCNDLQISKFIFHQIIKSDILKLYVERVVNKNETYYRSERKLFLTIWIYFYLSESISIYLNLFLSIWIYIYLSESISIYLNLFLVPLVLSTRGKHLTNIRPTDIISDQYQ